MLTATEQLACARSVITDLEAALAESDTTPEQATGLRSEIARMRRRCIYFAALATPPDPEGAQ